MNSDVRDRMIASATRLLATQGVAGASFGSVIQHSGTPRGSIYHHFPRGKDELIGEALVKSRAMMLDSLGQQSFSSPEDVAVGFLGVWRMVLENTGFSTGCAVTGVVASSGDEDLLKRSNDVFVIWTTKLVELLTDTGLRPEQAKLYATTLLSTAEGAVVLARASASMDSFDLAAEGILELLRSLQSR